MSVQDLGSIGELVAAVATVGTLIYLALQIRRNTAATLTATHQTQVDSTVGIQSSVANDPDLAELIPKAGDAFDSLTPGEHLRLLYFYACHFNLWHAAYWNRRNGLLAEHAWIPWENAMTLILKNQIACRRVCANVEEIYDPDFVSYVGRIVEDISNTTGSNVTFGAGRVSTPHPEPDA